MGSTQCDINSIEYIKLKPGQSIVFYGFISDRSRERTGQTLKLAFLYYENGSDLLNILGKKKPREGSVAYWSNEVKLEDNLFTYKIDSADHSPGPVVSR